MTNTRNRPLGVTILAVLILLVGVGLIVRGVLGLINGGDGGPGILVAIVLIVVGAIYLLVAKGILNGNRGSRLIVTILTLIALIGSIFTLMDPGEVVASIIQIIISIVILALMYGRQARQFFA